MKKLTRRTVIAGATLVPAAAIRSAAQSSTFAEFALLEAAVDRLIPSDDGSPGAKQCGAANYIVSAIASEKTAFLEGLAGIDAEAKARFGGPFTGLAASDQDQVLAAIETKNRPFFNRLRQLTLEGTFGDPSYGGNRGFAGWDLIRYPGPRLAVAPEDQAMRDPIKPLRRSAGHNH